MPFLHALEKRFGQYAVPGLIRYFVAFTAATYVLSLANPKVIDRLILDGPLILNGDIWRLVTWPFLPPTITFFGMNLPLFVQVILMVFILQCYWMFGELLESSWGAFRVNAFFFLGMATCIAAAIVFQTGSVIFTANLTLGLLFAVATVAPDFQILLFMILPVRLKWIAWLSIGFLIVQFVLTSWLGKIVILLCFANCIVFLGPSLWTRVKQTREIAARRARFKIASTPLDTLHRCETCGRTEVSNPELDFRVSSDGHEYCTEHLPAKVSQA